MYKFVQVNFDIGGVTVEQELSKKGEMAVIHP